MNNSIKESEYIRQLFHIGLGSLYALTLLILGLKSTILLAIAVLCFGTAFSLALKHNYLRVLPEFFMTHLNYLLVKTRRPHEHLPGQGVIVFLAALIFVTLIFKNPLIVALSILVLAFGDAFSCLAGKLLGKNHIHDGKTVEGTLAGTFAAMAPLVLVISPVNAFLVAFPAMLAEFLPIEDNFIIPIVAGFILSVLI